MSTLPATTAQDWITFAIALVGAGAWIPQIVAWLRRPEIFIVFGEIAEVSFMNFGAVINVPVSIASFRRAALVESISLLVTHQQGTQHTYKCVGLSESSTARSSSGETTLFGRESKVHTLALAQDSAAERLILFREESMSAAVVNLLHKTMLLGDRLRATDGQDWRPAMERSPEFAEWSNLVRDGNPWRSGEYSCVLTARVRQLPNAVQAHFSFTLTDADIVAMRNDRTAWELFVRNQILQHQPPLPRPQPYFANPVIRKATHSTP